MRAKTNRPRCYNSCGRSARNGSLFCSQRCAAEWGEGIAQGNEEVWCENCGEWVSEHPEHPTVKWISDDESVA